MLSDPLCDSVNRDLNLARVFIITSVKKKDMSTFSNVKNISKCKKVTVIMFTNENKLTAWLFIY